MSTKPPRTETIAKLLIINHKNEALILIVGEHRKYPEKSFQPDLPGGITEPGEPEMMAAIRETQEECGIVIAASQVKLAYAKTEFYNRENKSVSKFLYITQNTTTPEVVLSWEHSAYKWVPVGELLQSVALRPFFKEAVGYCLANRLIGS